MGTGPEHAAGEPLVSLRIMHASQLYLQSGVFVGAALSGGGRRSQSRGQGHSNDGTN